MGRERLEAELAVQGLDERTIAAAVRELYDEMSERERAERLLRAKALTPAQLKRRGFSDETIDAVLKPDPDGDDGPFDPMKRMTRGRRRISGR